MKIKGVELGGAPRVAAVITGGVEARTVRKALRDGADLIEIRVDTFEDLDIDSLTGAFKRLTGITAPAGVPVVLTVRSAREGGKTAIPDKTRAGIFDALIPFSDIVDIELGSSGILKNVVESAKKRRRKVIVSYHNFRSTPNGARLLDIIERGRAAGADIVKIAAAATGTRGLRRLAGLLVDHEGLIVIAMGDAGGPSRVFFPFLGSMVTYGSAGEATAPGQLSVKELVKRIRLFGGR